MVVGEVIVCLLVCVLVVLVWNGYLTILCTSLWFALCRWSFNCRLLYCLFGHLLVWGLEVTCWVGELILHCRYGQLAFSVYLTL